MSAAAEDNEGASAFGLPSPARPQRLPLGMLHAQLARLFFGFSALAGLGGAILLLTQESSLAGRWLAAACAAHGALALAGLATPKRWLPLAMPALVLGAMVLIAAVAIWLPGPRALQGLPLYGLMIYLLFSAAGERAGTLGVAVALSLLALVYFGPGSAPWPGEGLPVGLGAQVLGVLAGWAGGASIVRLLASANRRAEDREARFRQLLGVAAELYWEMDAEHRLVVFSNARTAQPLERARQFLGQVPWQVPGVVVDPTTLDTLLADIGRGEPFRDARLSWAAPGAALRHWHASGEPRRGDDGALLGYWGVAREITAELRTQAELDTTRSRYQELFKRNPGPLLLHRHGRILDVNPAALEMLGRRADEVLGQELLSLFEGGPQIDRVRERLAAVEAQPVGAALPVAEYRLRSAGRELAVRTTGVRVQMDDGPAVLTLIADDTERMLAEEQLRGSKTMLEHLVATSPDLITLTEAATGRYVMVNRSFERTTGWSAGEAVGRTSADLGIWQSAQERTAFVEALREGSDGAQLPIVFRARDGHAVQLVVSAARFVLEGREYLVINGRDVTEAERERLERAAILDSASVGIAVTRRGRFVIANRRLEQMLGWPAGELAGQPTHVQWPDRETYAAAVAEVVPRLERGEAVELEQPLQRRDGSRFLASMRGLAVRPGPNIEIGFVWCVEDITERREFEQQLARARDAAEAANRAKSAFLANTSHELRTPLNAMLGFAQLARDPALPAQRRDQYIEQIVDGARTLSSLIGDILDLSRIEAGRLEIEVQPFDLGALLRSLEQGHRALAAERGLALELDIAADCDGWVRGDALRLRQVLGNFLGNALKFTDAGWVRLTAAAAGEERVRIAVADSGHGIEPEVLPQLFEAFSQADVSTTRRHGGAGLGLAICRQLAALMGGSVGVDSVPGVGSRFWIELPLPRQVAAPGTGPGAATPDASAEGGSLAATAPAPLTEAARPLAGLRVLVAEDHEVNMLIAVAMLERWGAEVVQAVDGVEAVAAVEAARRGEAPPLDLVLMDLQMPRMSGHEATRRLREAGVRLPIVALTAAALVGEREQALAAGLDDFLTKPIDAALLRDTLLHWAGRRAARP
jgi:PAS domain S-box-containing protein